MITPNEIAKKAESKYYDYLRSLVDNTVFLPIIINGNKKPNPDTVTFQKEITDLINHSKEKIGYGYTVEYQTIKTKNHGLQGLPVSISFQIELDFIKFIKKETATSKFKENFEKIIPLFPELKEWICKYPNKVIENREWDSLLNVCKYFKTNPKPNLFIRELPIKVHTKFIENNKGIIKELLDIILANDINSDEKDFETRFGLKTDIVIRFRILDTAISQKFFSGIDDLCIPATQFKILNLPVSNVYIVENKKNMLTFPLIPNSIVIWGVGYGVKVLNEIKWLSDKNIFYWGDIDIQGFEILSQVRTYFPNVQSFLMDRETFNLFNENDKGKESKVSVELNLTTEEKELHNYLKTNNLRLEQEKIPLDYANNKIPFA